MEESGGDRPSGGPGGPRWRRRPIPHSGIPRNPMSVRASPQYRGRTRDPDMNDGGVFAGSALVFLVVIVALWLFGRHRLRAQARRLHALMDHRLAERGRAFADLHDALLQDVQGLTLSLQAIADQMPPNAPVRRRLEH